MMMMMMMMVTKGRHLFCDLLVDQLVQLWDRPKDQTSSPKPEMNRSSLDRSGRWSQSWRCKKELPEDCAALRPALLKKSQEKG